MKEYAIYSTITGGYDNIKQPLVIDSRFDYILFTDVIKDCKKGIWEIRTIPYWNIDNTRLSRYPKMHPEELLPEYKASLYLDANIQIVSSKLYDAFIKCYTSSYDWAGVKHPYRDCIYDEAYQVLANGLDTETNVFDWCHVLREKGYPRHMGMYENNIIFRKNNQNNKLVDELWWSLYETYSRRDQLTLMYAFWKYPQNSHSFFFEQNENAWNSDAVVIHQHNNLNINSRKRAIDQGFLQHARSRCRTGMVEKENRFREFHYWLYGLKPAYAKLFLNLWGIYSIIFYGIIIKYRAFKKNKL